MYWYRNRWSIQHGWKGLYDEKLNMDEKSYVMSNITWTRRVTRWALEKEYPRFLKSIPKFKIEIAAAIETPSQCIQVIEHGQQPPRGRLFQLLVIFRGKKIQKSWTEERSQAAIRSLGRRVDRQRCQILCEWTIRLGTSKATPERVQVSKYNNITTRGYRTPGISRNRGKCKHWSIKIKIRITNSAAFFSPHICAEVTQFTTLHQDADDIRS